MYQWKEDTPIQVSADLSTPHFVMENVLTEYCTSKTNTGTYSCMAVFFLFRREVSYYLLTIYIPLAMFVLVSWVAFWVNPRTDGTSRTLLTFGSLLGATALIAYTSANSAAVSYCRRLDTYTGVCLLFIFASILECASVNYLIKQADITDESRQFKIVKLMKSMKLDRYSRIAFPVLFVLFVIIYSCVTFI